MTATFAEKSWRQEETQKLFKSSHFFNVNPSHEYPHIIFYDLGEGTGE